MNELFTCRERAKRKVSKTKSVWCIQRQKWNFLSRGYFNYLRCFFDVQKQKQRVNTRCCFLFKRNLLCLRPLPCPSEVQWKSAGAVKWIAGLAGWSSDRRQKFVMDILSWMTALRFQVEPVSVSNLWNHSPTKTEEQRRHHGVPPCLWEIRSKSQTSASLPFTMLSSPFADLLQLILIKSYKFGVTVDVWKFLIARTSHLWRHAVLPRQPCMLI